MTGAASKVVLLSKLLFSSDSPFDEDLLVSLRANRSSSGRLLKKPELIDVNRENTGSKAGLSPNQSVSKMRFSTAR
jgi:hypothetical protein